MTVLLLAVVYLGLILVVLAESSLAARGAERYRSRVIAEINAENGLELGWASADAERSLNGGRCRGQITWSGGRRFELTGWGEARGWSEVNRRVSLEGRVEDDEVVVESRVEASGW